MTGKELYYIAEAHFNGRLAGDGPFTQKCHDWIEQKTGGIKALLVHSCTAALELAALLLDLDPGDEVIMPSYTFVSTANAFALRGAVPVFVDIREDTLNLDETLIEQAVTSRTRAVVPVHYAGVGCEMDSILSIAGRHGLKVVEDAAQGMMGIYKGRALGSIGNLGCFSFHETKNLISGEGGALLINEGAYMGKRRFIVKKARTEAVSIGAKSKVYLAGNRFLLPAGRTDLGVSVGATRGGGTYYGGEAEGMAALSRTLRTP